MNRLILVGNGFDLAHKMKTDYNSFLKWYLIECFNKAHTDREYHDPLINLPRNEWRFGVISMPGIKSISDLIEYCYKNGFKILLNDHIKIQGRQNNYPNPFQLTFNSKFAERLILNYGEENWVDIENEFYLQLKICKKPEHISITSIQDLNDSLSFIIQQLNDYLASVSCNKFNDNYFNLINSKIIRDDINKCELKKDELPKNSMVLNFNYTPTFEHYIKKKDVLSDSVSTIEINYIHGEISNPDNPLIFGFGDELDEEYLAMERTNINEFFEYIKSFWYFKTSNYHNLIRFIESDEYQIYILGHSCGLSDRTLLNMIFNHSNCKSIKIYYHGDEKKNNYTHLTQEISRHFSDKAALRDKIVRLPNCEPMPQVL